MTALRARAREDVACALCGSRERTLRFAADVASVFDCDGCALTYVSPRLPAAELVEHVYDASYWSSSAPRERGYDDYRADAARYLKTYAKRVRAFEHHFAQPGRVLDVGCAAGFFLEVMRARGWETFGVEPSAAILATARERLDGTAPTQLTCQPIEDEPFRGEEFDLITLWDVLEHLTDPVATLRQLRERLAPGGKLVIETQNVASLAARVLGSRWHHYKHDEHLVHFNRSTLRRAVERAGLRWLAGSSARAGKVVDLAFVAERATRVSPLVAGLLGRVSARFNPSFYVNLHDELIVTCEAA